MGGSNQWFQQLFGGQMQQAAPQYTNEQIMNYARSNNSNYDGLEKYKNEIVAQLRNGSYRDPNGVWKNVMSQENQGSPIGAPFHRMGMFSGGGESSGE